MKIGIVGSRGDLGSQLLAKVLAADIDVLTCDSADETSSSIDELLRECEIVHFCVPLDKLDHTFDLSFDNIIVLHDSVMSTSKEFNHRVLSDKASIVHMLMNDACSVVIAENMINQDNVRHHFESLGYTTHTLSIDAHDMLMAQSQAPYALLIKALHIPLHEQHDRGLLTPSGQLLMESLDSRVLAWTPETISSILKNPKLDEVISDIKRAHEIGSGS